MNNRYNDILIKSLEDCNSWDDLKPKLEAYNTSETKQTKKDTIAGKIFEFFAKYYFLTEPEQTDLYDEVWLYEELPIEVSKKLKLPTIDHGIDLVLKDIYGKFHAIQCKFKNDEDKKLSWSGDKIANVFALGTLCDSVIVFTNAADVTNVAKNFKKYSQITYEGLVSIQPDIFHNILKLAKKQQPTEIVKYKPREHQENAIQSVSNHLNNNDRGQLILPCGAGKTLTALWIKERLECKNTLVLLPSLALLKQIKNDWARHKNQSYKYICVCSEKDIDKDSTDSITVHTYEIGGPVTTDPEIVNEFLKRSENKVVFSTYQSLRVIQEACAKFDDFEFCLTICDEAHRTAGSKNKNVYTLVHDNNKIPSDKRLYMTATPKVVSTSLKKRLGEEYDLLCDMSNPTVFGEEAFRMTFGEAIEQDILVDYKIVGIGVTDKQVKEFIESRNYIGEITIDELAHNFSLDLVMNKYKAFHALTFHSRVILAKEFANRHKYFYNETFSEHVEGKQTTTYRAKVLHNFKSSEKGIVSNARCLTEGVDVPTIDLIYFCDPKTSKIDIVQASGRALRTDSSGKKLMGYIVVPLFHHIEEDVEQEIKKKPIFNYLIQVVRSLCDQDERLQAEIDSIAFKKGKRNSKRIEINIPDTEKIIKFEGLEEKLKKVLFDEIIEKNKDNWEVMFLRLVEFKEQNGHMDVGRKEDPQLQNWIYERRRQNRAGTLPKSKKERLNEIGFDWKSEEFREITDFDDIWFESYQKLVDYYKEHGDTDIPARYKKDKPLGTWAVAQRAKKRNGELEKVREELLEEIDFNWNPKVKVFDLFCERLIEFKNEFGHTEVPVQSKQYPKLGRWTNKYRVILNNGTLQSNGSITHTSGTLTKKQIDKLKALGFKESVRKTRWEDYYEELKQHYENFGNTRPNQNDNYSLYSWCYRIRKHQNNLTQKQRDLLDAINFEYKLEYKFSTRNWHERLIELQLFYDEHKNFNISSHNEEFDGLYRWLIYQRRLFNKNELPFEKLAELKSIGFDFSKHLLSSADTDWEDRFDELTDYYSKNNTFFISGKDTEHKSLLSWLRYQRKLFREGNLSEEKIDKLITLGFSFTENYRSNNAPITRGRNNDDWLIKFELLKEYCSKYKTFMIPKSNKEYSHLTPWVQYQKKLYRENKLPTFRKEKLLSIGFDFNISYQGRSFELVVNPEQKEAKVSVDKDHAWKNKFQEFEAYFEENKTYKIPSSNKELQPLRAWVLYQRNLFRKENLEDWKINEFKRINYSFDLDFRGRKSISENDSVWDGFLNQLKAYHSEYNTFLIPQSKKEYAELKKWIQSQKRLNKLGRVSEERLKKLEEIGFSFDLNYSGKVFSRLVNPEIAESGKDKVQKPDVWETNYMALLDFKVKHGHCNVTRSINKSLANFVFRQRSLYRQNRLLESQIKKLELLGIEWEVTREQNSDAWQNKFELLKDFFIKNGHSRYLKRYGDESLYSWVLLQRMEKRKGNLKPDRIKALDSINFLWETTSSDPEHSRADDDKWFAMLEKLEAYKNKHGDCLVPQLFAEDKSLGRWVNDQRNNRKNNRISQTRIDLLNDLGFVWDTKEHEWNQKLELLRKFYEVRGHFDVKQKDQEFDGLYYWIYRINKVGTTADRIEKLNKIGYDTSRIKLVE